MSAPEESARQQIDEALTLAGWAVQDVKGSTSALRGASRSTSSRSGRGMGPPIIGSISIAGPPGSSRSRKPARRWPASRPGSSTCLT